MLRCATQVTAKDSVKGFPPSLSELWQSGKAAPQSICIEYYDDGVTITDITLMVDQEKTGRTVHEVRQPTQHITVLSDTLAQRQTLTTTTQNELFRCGHLELFLPARARRPSATTERTCKCARCSSLHGLGSSSGDAHLSNRCTRTATTVPSASSSARSTASRAMV